MLRVPLRRVAGEQAVRLIRREPDKSIMRIVQTWVPAREQPTTRYQTQARRRGPQKGTLPAPTLGS
jgi:hypothetical protein